MFNPKKHRIIIIVFISLLIFVPEKDAMNITQTSEGQISTIIPETAQQEHAQEKGGTVAKKPKLPETLPETTQNED